MEAGALRSALLLLALDALVCDGESGPDGVVGTVKDLASGAELGIRAEQAFPAASTIELAVPYELCRRAEEGRIDLDEVTVPPLRRAISER